MTPTYQVFLSALAAEKVKSQMIKRGTPDGYLRWGVKGGGCSGFSYVLQFEDTVPKEKDLVFIINEVKIVIDPKSILYLNAVTLDWSRNLIDYGFKFINPNETSRCGCGQSFAI